MGEPSLRAIAVAGLISAGLLVGGPAVAPAGGQPTDSDASSQATEGAGGGADDDGPVSSSSSGGSQPGKADDDAEPEVQDAVTDESDESDESAESDEVDATRSGTVDDLLEPQDDELARSDDDTEGGRRDSGLLPTPKPPQTFQYSHSLRIPIPRLPAPGEIPAGSWPTVSSFYTTVEIPVPTLQEFLQSLAINPTPAPPGPSIRTQEEEPVVDAGTGAATAGGGGGGMMSEAPVMRAPLVVAVPRVATVGGPGSRPAESIAAPAPGVTQPGTAGARTPVIRSSLPSSAEAAPKSILAPFAGPSTRLGYPRSLTNPTLAELAAVALPGVAGLLLLTFGGGVIGYRQANSVRFVRTPGAERFLP